MAQPFPFLDLPPELRTRILLHLIQNPAPIPLSSLPQTYPHALLLVSAQIHAEVLSLYYNTNTFVMTLLRDNELLLPFLSSPSRYLVRSLKIKMNRWGANDFFIKRFAPIVEDMILKGALRKLEVFVKEELAKCWEVGKGVDMQNWRVLKKLLADPDLEFAKLKSVAGKPSLGGLSAVISDGERDITWLIED